MRWLAIASVGAVLLGAAAPAQRNRLPAECRAQIVQLCRAAPEGLRECARAQMPRLSDTCRTAIGQRAAAQVPRAPGMAEHAYGAHPRQRLDLARPAGVPRAPILLFVHGGGWSAGDKRHAAADKARWANANGWAFASANYRLVPQATVEQQAADIAGAIAWLRANAAREGLDPDRIVVMGHSAGAHLAALVGSDPAYLAAAGAPIRAVTGIILLDGAGYDIALQMASPRNLVKPIYESAFGNDPARHKALSPANHAAAPNVQNWLILPVSGRRDSLAQSNRLAAGLAAAGSNVSVAPVDGETHASLNRGLGEAGDAATQRIDRFLAELR